MNILKCSCAKNWGSIAPLLLRLVAGIIFLMHGLQKTADISMFGGFLGSVGVPAPHFFAWAVVVLELAGGLALILGFLTHWVSKLFVLQMLAAIFLVHASKGFMADKGGYEFALLLLVVVISLMITGAGKWSLDEWLLGTCCGKCEGGVCSEHGGGTAVK
jgi:putative oxidoreductase